MSASLNSFDLLGETSRRRLKAAAKAPVWPVVHRRGGPAASTPAMDAPAWPGSAHDEIHLETTPPPVRETLVPPVPDHLRRSTVEPALAREECVPLPPERLRGPAELEFEDFDADWFVEGTMETAPPREEIPEPVLERAPTWVLAIPVLACGIMVGMGAMMMLFSLLTG